MLHEIEATFFSLTRRSRSITNNRCILLTHDYLSYFGYAILLAFLKFDISLENQGIHATLVCTEHVLRCKDLLYDFIEPFIEPLIEPFIEPLIEPFIDTFTETMKLSFTISIKSLSKDKYFYQRSFLYSEQFHIQLKKKRFILYIYTLVNKIKFVSRNFFIKFAKEFKRNQKGKVMTEADSNMSPPTNSIGLQAIGPPQLVI